MNTIKTWEERHKPGVNFTWMPTPITDAMQAEIAELRAALAARATPAHPVATAIKHGAERTFMSENMGKLPDGTYALYLHPAPSPSTVAEAIRKLPLPETENTIKIGMFEVRAWTKSHLCDLLSEAAALAEQDPASEDAKFLTWVKAHRPSWIREWRRQLPAAPSIPQDGQGGNHG